MKASKILYACLKRADDKFHLIDNGDKIVVGVSLGKDSMSMLKALKIFQFYSSKKYTIKPVYIDFGFGKVNLKPFKNFCKDLGLELDVVESKEVFKILEKNKKKNLLPCSICSRMRKASLCKYASKIGYNKIALGHHLDDYLITLLMNMKNSNIVDTFSPKMFLSKTKITCIRPLILIKENIIKKYVEEERIPVEKSKCPNTNNTARYEVGKLLNILDKAYPGIKENYLESMSNLNSLPNRNFEETHLGNNFYIKKINSLSDFASYVDLASKCKVKIDSKLIRKEEIFNAFENSKLLMCFNMHFEEKKIIISNLIFDSKKSDKISLFLNQILECYFNKIKPLKMEIKTTKTFEKNLLKFGFKIKNNVASKEIN